MGSIVFVHGTGVRLAGYSKGLEGARECARNAGIAEELRECAWGEVLGVDLPGLSLPVPPSRTEAEVREFEAWQWLLHDPFSELENIRYLSQPSKSLRPPHLESAPEALWAKISNYRASTDLIGLLDRESIRDLWEGAWRQCIVESDIPKLTLLSAEDRLTDASHALARAVIAQLCICATDVNRSGPSQSLRNKLVERLVRDWDQQVYGIGETFLSLVKKGATMAARSHRAALTRLVSNHIGDILLYQAKASDIQSFIAGKIQEAQPPVTIVAHSLGGIATVELFMGPNRPNTACNLVTVGSQIPFFFEIGALRSMRVGETLPQAFPKWLNIFDSNDFLSYVGERLWPGAIEDAEISSGLPFPNSHNAYFTNPAVWSRIGEFMRP